LNLVFSAQDSVFEIVRLADASSGQFTHSQAGTKH
jgi:hypothetical protein